MQQVTVRGSRPHYVEAIALWNANLAKLRGNA
jgi:hypothetical protein